MEQMGPTVKVKALAPHRKGEVVRIHYHNPGLEGAYAGLWLWCWGPWPRELDVPATGVSDYGAFFDVPVPRGGRRQAQGFGFKLKDREGTDGAHWYEFDRSWQRRDGWEVFTSVGDDALHSSPHDALRPRLVGAVVRDLTTIDLVFDRPVVLSDLAGSFRLEPDGDIVGAAPLGPGRVRLTTAPLDLSRLGSVVARTEHGEVHAGVYPREVMDGFVTDAPLGSWVDGGRTSFAVWSPRASSVSLEIARDPWRPAAGRHAMARGEDGVWRATLRGNLHGEWYGYVVDGPEGPGEAFRPYAAVNDPYGVVAARSGTAAGRTMVVDLDRIPRPRPLERRPTLADLVAWEVHVRDFTGGPGAGLSRDDPARRAYLGFTRAGLTSPDGLATGLDHLSELGVNAVQLLPIQEYPWPRDRYRWGYITANFFSPHSGYATHEASDARLREVVAMVDALHARGIAVICDVVFNHTAEGDTTGPSYNLRGLDSKYYYRQDPATFRYHNGSGCGNELASERPMARRLIVDACRFWVERLGVDGFRFDLASLLDLATLKAIEEALPEDILLYGEPWSAGRAFWGRGDLNSWPRWAVFDDVYRDAVKGNPEGGRGGFVQGEASAGALLTAVSGNTLNFGGGDAWAPRPTAGLRYLTCHDNLTLHDKLCVSLPGAGEEEIRARSRLAAIIQLTSLGPVLLHGGVELLRSKPYRPGHDGRANRSWGDGVFDANTYKAPDAVNNLDWRRKAKYQEEVELYAGLIRLRRSPLGACLRRPEAPDFASLGGYLCESNPRAVGWHHNDDRSWGDVRMRVFVNACREHAAPFEITFDHGPWALLCDGRRIDPAGLGPVVRGATTLILEPLSAAIFVDAPHLSEGKHPTPALEIVGPGL